MKEINNNDPTYVCVQVTEHSLSHINFSSNPEKGGQIARFLVEGRPKCGRK